MANVNIKFNNKEFLLSCEDGQEEHLQELSLNLNEKFDDLLFLEGSGDHPGQASGSKPVASHALERMNIKYPDPSSKTQFSMMIQ